VTDVSEALPRLLLAVAVVLGAYFMIDDVVSLLRSNLQTGESRPAQPSPPSAAAPATKQAAHTPAEPTRNAFDNKRAPLRPPAQPAPALPLPPHQATDDTQQAVPCEADVRIAGVAHMRASAGDPLVLLSGAGVRKGLRRIGGHVAGKTVAAIFPTAVVLRDPTGRECWVKMSSAHAREVAGEERRASIRAAEKRHREEQREKASATRKSRAARRKKR